MAKEPKAPFTETILRVRALATEGALSHAKDDIKTIYAMPVSGNDTKYFGGNLGTRWSALLREVIGQDYGSKPLPYKTDEHGALVIDLPVGSSPGTSIEARRNDIHIKAQPLSDAHISYEIKIISNG